MSEIKLTICVPTSGTNPAAFTWSYGALIGYLSSGLKTRPDCTLYINTDWNCSSCIQSNREILVRRTIDRGSTHLLFLDHDMKFDPQAVDLLFSRRHPVVACNYLIKRLPPETPDFVAVGLNGRRVPTTKESMGIQEIAYSGFGVSLFETAVFKKVPQPWFEPKFVPQSSMYTTEDNPCYERIRAAGFTCFLDHEASKLVEHIGDFAWKWDQWKKPEKQLCVVCRRERNPNCACPPDNYSSTPCWSVSDLVKHDAYKRNGVAKEVLAGA